jgi:hypothetical protein
LVDSSDRITALARHLRVVHRTYRRPFALVLALTSGLAVGSVIASAQAASAWDSWGVDLKVWVALGRRWLDTGSLYTPQQLAGPYPVNAFETVGAAPALYPPVMGPILAVVASVPAPLLALWWIAPLGTIAWCLMRWRPAPWTWPLMAACAAWPQTGWQLIVGGTSMWVCAFVAGGLVWRPLSALVLLKPSLAIFALVGSRDRWWWVAVAALVTLNLAGPWEDYVRVIWNGTGSGGILYSLGHYGLMAIPVIAFLGRQGVATAIASSPGR